LDSKKWADFFSCLSQSKGINGKAKVDRYIFENINSTMLSESGNDEQIIFKPVPHYIFQMLKKMDNMRNFHIKELQIKDCTDDKKDCTLENEAFKSILSVLCKAKLETLHLWGIDFKKTTEEDKDSNEDKSSILQSALEYRILQSTKAKDLELRILRCRNFEKFSFLKLSGVDNSMIKSISMTECNLTDDDFADLLPILFTHKNLKSVNLGNNRLSMKSLELLKNQAVNFGNNRVHFYLHGNKSGDEFLNREKVNEFMKGIEQVEVSC
jgi:hypothetical protein